jgi:hypothetical protein
MVIRQLLTMVIRYANEDEDGSSSRIQRVLLEFELYVTAFN